MTESLALRAARYFGVHDEPRTSIPLGDGAVVIVCTRMGRQAFMVYDEGRGGARLGTYSLLTEKRRADLAAALGQEGRRDAD